VALTLTLSRGGPEIVPLSEERGLGITPRNKPAPTGEKLPGRGPMMSENRAASGPVGWVDHSSTTSIFEAVRTFLPASSDTSPVARTVLIVWQTFLWNALLTAFWAR
jgi:hypothetical protein